MQQVPTRTPRDRRSVAWLPAAGRYYWRASMSVCHFCVRSTGQTTYGTHDRPDKIRITHPPHPLCGQTLSVIQRRREIEQSYWIVRLPDGSGVQLPAEWTDHPLGLPSSAKVYVGGKATPRALRDLIDLITGLAHRTAAGNGRPNDHAKGGNDEQPAASIRNAGNGADSEDLAATQRQGQTTDRHHPGPDGQGGSDEGPDNRQGGQR